MLRDAGLANLALRARPSFGSLDALFETLDMFAPFKYVVHRSHLAVVRAGSKRALGVFVRGGKDVDLLVNDYYFFKAIAGAQSTDRVRMREQNSAGHIQSTVLVGGREVHSGRLLRSRPRPSLRRNRSRATPPLPPPAASTGQIRRALRGRRVHRRRVGLEHPQAARAARLPPR